MLGDLLSNDYAESEKTMHANDELEEKNKLELYILFGLSITFIIIVLIIAIKYPDPTIFQYTVFRIILALFSAGIAAMIPGVINLNLSLSKQNYIRAGGAISVFVIIYFYSPAALVLEKTTSSSHLSADVFGKNLDNQTIAFESIEEAKEKNAKLFNGAKRSIRIVTVHGKSWLRDQVIEPNFKRALKNGEVDLLVVDPLSDAFRILKLSQKDGIGKEDPHHQERMDIDEIRSHYNYYRDIFAKHKEKSSLRYYSKFPWIRFAIYDDQHATFVLTPFLKTGTKSTIFYTSDPWLIKCLEEIFEEFKSSSKAIEHEEEYENLWPQLQKKYSW